MQKKIIIVQIKKLLNHENILGSIAVYDLNELHLLIPTKDKLKHWIEVLAVEGVEVNCEQNDSNLDFEHHYDLVYEDLDLSMLQTILQALQEFLRL